MNTRIVKSDIEEKFTTPLPLVETKWSVPLDVQKAIQREAEADPSDPFVARRLLGHYRQGIWTPADAKAK